MEAHLIEHDKEPHCEDKEREYKSDNNTDNEGTYHYSDEDFDENDNNSDNEGKYNFPDEEPPQTPEEARPAALSSNLKLASHQDRAGSKDGPSVKKTKFTKNFEASHASYYNKSPNKYKEPLLNHITESPTQEERESIDLLEASKIIKNSKKRSREEYEHDEDKSADGKAEETQTLQKFGVWSRRLNKDITQGQKLKGKDVLKLSKLGSDFTRELVETILKGEREPTAEEIQKLGRLKANLDPVPSRSLSNMTVANNEMASSHAADQALGEDVSLHPAPQKTGYKSYKKKYRKILVEFNKTMDKSHELFRQEQEAIETAQRLAFENEQILDMLLDNNFSMSGAGKIDLEAMLPGSNAIPRIPPPFGEMPVKPEGLTEEGRAAHEEHLAVWKYAQSKEDAKYKGATTSLAKLMTTVPHQPFEVTSRPPSVAGIPLISNYMAKDLEITKGKPYPVAYLSPERLDEMYNNLDRSLGLKPQPTLNTISPDFVPAPPHLSDRDLEFKNPNSAYNWLRINKPNIFLQDSEPASLIEKAATKPGALRGAGKRAVLPAPSKPDAFEIVEEDGLDYNTSIGVVPAKEKGKRKRVSDEDGGYRPKGGSSRPKKKRSDSGKGSSVKKEQKSSPLATKTEVEDVEMEDAKVEFLAPE